MGWGRLKRGEECCCKGREINLGLLGTWGSTGGLPVPTGLRHSEEVEGMGHGKSQD